MISIHRTINDSISCIWRYNFRICHFVLLGYIKIAAQYAKMLSYSQCGAMS